MLGAVIKGTPWNDRQLKLRKLELNKASLSGREPSDREALY
jgi:hypothetical protein